MPRYSKGSRFLLEFRLDVIVEGDLMVSRRVKRLKIMESFVF